MDALVSISAEKMFFWKVHRVFAKENSAPSPKNTP